MKKMKKLLLLMAVVITVLLCFALSASAKTVSASGKCGDNVSYTYNSSTKELVISGSGEIEDYYLDSPFQYSDIKSVIIEEGITKIGDLAFYNCSELESLTLPGSMAYIGYDVFDGCDSMKSVYAPDLDSWLKIEFYSYKEFGGCYSSTPLRYKTDLYLGGELLTDLVIPEGTKEINDAAFFNCHSIESVTIPSSVTKIGDMAFAGCYDIKSVFASDIVSWLNIDFDYRNGIMDDGSTCYHTVDSNPLWNGANLYFGGNLVTDLVITEGITEIKTGAFEGCASLESVIIPDSVTSIGYSSFADCGKLKSVTIPDSITEIGIMAFERCNLESVYASDVQSWIKIKFDWFTEFIDGSLEVYRNFDSNPLSRGADLYFDGNVVTDLVIPTGTTEIKAAAFYNYDKLQKVTIPSSVTKIGYGSFAGCDNLTDVYYAGKKVQWEKMVAYSDSFDSATIHCEGCNPVERAQQNPTCTKVGYTAGVYCSACDAWHSGHEEIAKIPHKYTKYTSDKNATLLADGTKTALCDYGCKNKKTVTDTGSKLVLGDVTGLNATQTTTSVTLKWNKAKNATGYSIYYKLSGDLSWRECVSYTTATSYTFKNLPEGTVYTFAVRSVGKTSSKTFNGSYIAVKTATKAVRPATVVASQNTSAIKLTWSPCKGATGYRIYYKSGSSWKVAVSTTNMTSHTFKNLKAGAKYTFAIRPYVKNGGVVVWSDYTGFITATKPATVKATATSASKGKIALSWKAVNGAKVYNVYYKIGNGAYKLYNTYTKAGTLNFSTLKSGTKYTFAVRAGIKTSGGVVWGGYNEAAVTVK